MKYLKKFNLHTDYETYMDSQDLIYPNVSYCVDRNEVHFNPDPYNGHKYVDLGLPSGTLWATTNIGANSPEEYGLYFAWGETEGYPNISKRFGWADYKFNPSRDGKTMTKYNATDGLKRLDLVDDAAYVNWGEKWRMPTYDLLNELFHRNYPVYTTQNGVKGFLINSAYNSNSIFIPIAGTRTNGLNIERSVNSYYWSKDVYTNDFTFAKIHYTEELSYDEVIITNESRCHGLSIRPVVYNPSPK